MQDRKKPELAAGHPLRYTLVLALEYAENGPLTACSPRERVEPPNRSAAPAQASSKAAAAAIISSSACSGKQHRRGGSDHGSGGSRQSDHGAGAIVQVARWAAARGGRGVDELLGDAVGVGGGADGRQLSAAGCRQRGAIGGANDGDWRCLRAQAAQPPAGRRNGAQQATLKQLKYK